MIYAEDTASKDFVNLNSVGENTVRVLTGSHSNVIASPGFDALHPIRSLTNHPPWVLKIQRSINTKLVRRGTALSRYII
jgi:hypothetical protein